MPIYRLIIYAVVVPVLSLMVFRFFLSQANYYLNATKNRPGKHTKFYTIGRGRYFLVSFLLEDSQVAKSVIVLSITSFVSFLLSCVGAIIAYYSSIEYIALILFALSVINLFAILCIVNYNDNTIWTALGKRRNKK